jgi:hypothetical protein
MSTDSLASRAAELKTDFDRFGLRSPQMEAHISLKSGKPESVVFKVSDAALCGTKVSAEEQRQLKLELLSLTQMAGAIVSKKPFVIDWSIEKPWLDFLILAKSLYHSHTTTVDGAAVSICIPDYARVCASLLVQLKGCLNIIELAGFRQQELPSPKGIDKAAAESPSENDSPDWAAMMDAVAIVADPNTFKVLRAAKTSMSASEKMQIIYEIHRPALAWDSGKWATLLQVSDSAIRQTDWWKKERTRLMGGKD